MRKVYALMVLLFLLAACQQGGSSDTIKVGVLSDLSGDYANVLRGTHRGAEVAVADAEAVTGKVVELIIEDQKSCDTKETITILNKFINVDRVDFVIGGTCSSTTLAAAPVAEQAKMVMISPTSSAPSISSAGEYVFRTYISDLLRADESANLAYDFGYRKMAVITDINNDAAVEISKRTQEVFEELGGEVLIDEGIDKTAVEFRTQITKIKELNPDVLIIPITGPTQIGLVAKQARELGLDVQMIDPLETAESSETLEVGGEAVEGLIYMMPGNPPQTEQYQAFSAKYKDMFGDEVPSFAAESYDALMLGVMAVEASDGTPEGLKDALHDVSMTYEGVSGNVEFDENGDVTKPVLIKQVMGGEFVEYES